MVESAKDGSMERLLTASLGENDYQFGPSPQCFSGTSTVETEQGKIPIGNLKLGDNVLTYTPGKGGHFTEVIKTDESLQNYGSPVSWLAGS